LEGCATVSPPKSVWRVGRAPDPLVFTDPVPADALDSPGVGNRFDSALGAYRVLYFGNSLKSCYTETLSRLRPDLNLIKELDLKNDWDAKHFVTLGGVPADWRSKRLAIRASLENALPFLDVESLKTQQFLRVEMADFLIHLNYTDLDNAAICGPDRRLTRWISQWAHDRTDAEGDPVFSGIRYKSRLDPKCECWAVFEGTPIEALEIRPVAIDDPDLRKVAESYGLTIH
jgi:hypothetical protein